jgi:hypothetical protein
MHPDFPKSIDDVGSNYLDIVGVEIENLDAIVDDLGHDEVRQFG